MTPSEPVQSTQQPTSSRDGSAPRRVLVLNGPNLGRLGRRQPEVYGSETLADVAARCTALAADLGVQVEFRQTDSEAQMLGWVHDAADERVPVVINPGAWTHTSVALRDACAELSAGLVELHISNVHAREPFRRHSYLSDIATGVIAGLGTRGYDLALRWLAERER
ncbi:3-dehydroquinate dehydratase-2 [Kineococcus xinjiangensis]|uniref:3-dehydroquinate dehydratase n=1 Tax=Kineococcus xinjiangensis TaxID=512762 RepID=A0A2S6IT85_9ACTN|nr:type II 3-dehydroquinate dehydratase [Kineococcus xinjiangensis]PPK97463.1 3-dehydroquinate dehydratase-2 [Kineococcus xinjiangensis]